MALGRYILVAAPAQLIALVVSACAGGTNPGGGSQGPNVVSGGTDDSGATSADDGTNGGASSAMGQTSQPATDDGPVVDDTAATTGCVEQQFYFDGDGDGHGNPLAEVVACDAPQNHVPLDDDCDDEDPNNAPSLAETCDGQDNDCDTLVDEASAQNTTCDGCTLGERNGHAYAYCPQALPFAQARTTCQSFGGDLVVIEDMAENDFIVAEPTPATMGVGGFWIGLTDAAAEGTFVWVDGTAPTFTAWNMGEPNDGGGDEDCGEMSTTSGGWNDVGCAMARAFICEAAPS